MQGKELDLLNELKLLLNDKGYVIEDIIYYKSKNYYKRSLLKLIISNSNNTPINIEDCKKVSKDVSLIIDVKNLISEPYNLEVSSKGCEDSLFFVKDFINNIGKFIKVELFSAVKNKETFYAVISKITGNRITLKINLTEKYRDKTYSNKNNNLITVPINNIKSAVLVKDRSCNERTTV